MAILGHLRQIYLLHSRIFPISQTVIPMSVMFPNLGLMVWNKSSKQNRCCKFLHTGLFDRPNPIHFFGHTTVVPIEFPEKLGAEKQLVSDWLAVRRNKKLTNTETALKGFLKQVEKSGNSLNDVLTKCIEKSWGGFEADWYKKEKRSEEKIRMF